MAHTLLIIKVYLIHDYIYQHEEKNVDFHAWSHTDSVLTPKLHPSPSCQPETQQESNLLRRKERGKSQIVPSPVDSSPLAPTEREEKNVYEVPPGLVAAS